MTTLAKTPVTVVTGFLGSGKTTLISHLIRNAGGRRLAVVVNEFGTLGVDGEILKGCAIPDCPAENIVELSNGCICCTVADDFVPTVEALLAIADAVVVMGVIGIEEGATHGIATMSLAHHADKEIFQANKERWRSLH